MRDPHPTSPPTPSPLGADSAAAAWAVFAALTAVHVWANVRAMRCLVLTTLNAPRAELLLDAQLTRVSSGQARGCVRTRAGFGCCVWRFSECYGLFGLELAIPLTCTSLCCVSAHHQGRVLTPAEASAEESLLAPPFRAIAAALTALRPWRGSGGRRRRARPIVFGARPADVLRAVAAASGSSSGGGELAAARAAVAAAAAAGDGHIAALDASGRVLVAVDRGAGGEARLRAYLHALYLSRHADGAAAAASAAAPRGGGRRRGGGRGTSGGGGAGGAPAAAAAAAAAGAWMAGGGCDALLAEARAAGWQLEGASLPRPRWTGKWE